MTVSGLFDKKLGRAPHPGDSVRLGDVALVVHRVKDDHVLTVGLQLADEEEKPRWKRAVEKLRRFIG
jgi:NhaP-type Na+/H+ and K+/H+ antiporter